MTTFTPPANLTPTLHFCNETQLGYLRAGEAGEAIVLLHGWGAFKELWWSTLRELATRYRVFAPDMPGHGSSPVLGTSTMPQIADRIARFCTARGLDTITLAGHSMGGNVAVELALARPDLVRRLVLVDAAVQGRRLPGITRSYLVETYGFAALRLTLLLSKKTRRIGEMIPHDHGGGTLRPALRRFAYTANHDAADMHALLSSLISNTLEERASHLAIPTLVLSGSLDPLVPAALSRHLARAIPGAAYHEIRGAAHNPMDERPREFAQVLLDFMDKTATPPR